MKTLNEINYIIQKLELIDENILEKNILGILEYFFQKEEFINFLILQKESVARNLIDGLFYSDNDKDILIELNDIKAFIKVIVLLQN